MRKVIKAAFPVTLPVLAGYLFLGFGFGMLFVKSGYGAAWALSLSGFVYAGAMQFVTIDLINSGALLLEVALMTLMVNARHLFYGLAMAEKYKDTGKWKPYLAFSLTDETFALLSMKELPDGLDQRKYYLCVSALNQLYWLLGTAIGVLAGSLITLDLSGIEFSMTALFITMLVEQWRKKQNQLPVMIGLGAALLCLLVFGASAFTLPAMVLICGVSMLMKNTLSPLEGRA